MAKKKQHIDDFFKENMQGRELPLDGDEWGRLADALHPEKKRRFFWWWLLLLPVLVAGIWWMSERTASETDKSIYSEPQAADSSKPETLLADELSTDVPTSKDAATETQDDAITKSNGTAKAEEPSSALNKTRGTNNKSSDDKPVVTSDMVAGNTTSSTAASAEPRTIGLSGIDITSRKIGSIPYEMSTPSFPAKVSRDKMRPKSIKVDYIPKVYVGLNAGGVFSTQGLNSPDARFASYRDSNEYINAGLHLGANVQVQTERGFILGTGLQYQTQNLALGSAFNNSPELRIQLYDSIPFIDINGDTTWLPFNYRDSIVSNNINNPRVQYLSVPVSFGKTFQLSPTLSIEGSIELQTKLLLNASGNSLNPNFGVLELNTSQFNRFALSGGARFGMNYALTSSFSLRWNISGQFDLLDVNKENYVEQRYRNYRMDFGLYYRLR